MTQLSIGMLALQKDSKFAAKYDLGMKKLNTGNGLWRML